MSFDTRIETENPKFLQYTKWRIILNMVNLHFKEKPTFYAYIFESSGRTKGGDPGELSFIFTLWCFKKEI